MLVVVGDGPKPDVPSDEVREPAFGLKALWVMDSYAAEVRRGGFEPIDGASVLLTHLSEVIRNNLPQFLSYKDMRASSTGSTPNTSGSSTRSVRRRSPIRASRRC